jgi:hypothetical protein
MWARCAFAWQVYAAVNGKPLDDPEMVRLFEFKGYP